MLRLSVLDQSPVAEGSTGAAALGNSLDLARLTDSLGYFRYWVAEHHGALMLACTSPEALVGPIASATSNMRVGSGGVMLPHYSSLKVAETWSMLSGLYPGRIDLGIGRAAGTHPKVTFALQRDKRQPSPDDFLEQLTELRGYLYNRPEERNPYVRNVRLPGEPERPDIWLLGSSAQSAVWAAELGLPYVFADFIHPRNGHLAEHYRHTFKASAELKEPNVIVACSVICADTDAEAQRQAASWKMAITELQRGHVIPVPSIETAERYIAQERMPLDAPVPGRRAIIGSPAKVREGIQQAASEYGASEVMIVTITHDHAARRHSYELIAGAFDSNS